MLYSKPALTYERQVELLKSRGLSFDDEALALHCLKRIGYFRLSAYFIPFKVFGQDQFLPDATFQKIIDLYQFDARLRLLAMQAIDHIEVSVRASLTYKLGHESGPFGHGRLWNRELSLKPELLKEWEVSSSDSDRMYVVSLMLHHFVQHIAPTFQWKEGLIHLMSQYPGVSRPAMKFPADWADKNPWK